MLLLAVMISVDFGMTMQPLPTVCGAELAIARTPADWSIEQALAAVHRTGPSE